MWKGRSFLAWSQASSGTGWQQQSCFGLWPGSLRFRSWRLQPPNRIHSEFSFHSHLHSSASGTYSESCFVALIHVSAPFFTLWWCACRDTLQLKATPQILAFAQIFCVLEKHSTRAWTCRSHRLRLELTFEGLFPSLSVSSTLYHTDSKYYIKTHLISTVNTFFLILAWTKLNSKLVLN